MKEFILYTGNLGTYLVSKEKKKIGGFEYTELITGQSSYTL